jgi:hypothetical protein
MFEKLCCADLTRYLEFEISGPRRSYLQQGLLNKTHPLGRLADDVFDVFNASYGPPCQHGRLLRMAVPEAKELTTRLDALILDVFPELVQTR